MQKTVVITGASSGIGRATALYFAQKGWSVFATMRNTEKAGDLTTYPSITAIQLDVTDPASIQKAFALVLAKSASLDVIVNNAGYGIVGPFETTDSAEIQKEIATNVLGVMNVTRAILHHFRERKVGTIITIASMGGRLTFPFYSIYHASKWSDSINPSTAHFELRQFNIKVKLIEPGVINTPLLNLSA